MIWAIAPLCRSVFLISCCEQLESTTPLRTSTTSSPPFWLKLFVILVQLFFGGSAATTPSSTSILCGWWRTLNPAGRISCSFFSASLRVHSLSSRLYLSSCITQRSWEISPPSSSSPWRFIKFLWNLQRYTTCGPAGARTAPTRNKGPLEGQEGSTQRFCCEELRYHLFLLIPSTATRPMEDTRTGGYSYVPGEGEACEEEEDPPGRRTRRQPRERPKKQKKPGARKRERQRYGRGKLKKARKKQQKREKEVDNEETRKKQGNQKEKQDCYQDSSRSEEGHRSWRGKQKQKGRTPRTGRNSKRDLGSTTMEVEQERRTNGTGEEGEVLGTSADGRKRRRKEAWFAKHAAAAGKRLASATCGVCYEADEHCECLNEDALGIDS